MQDLAQILRGRTDLGLSELLILALQLAVVLPLQLHLMLKVSLQAA